MSIIPAPLMLSKCLPKDDETPITLRVTIGNAQLSKATYEIKRTVNAPIAQEGELENGKAVDLGPGFNLLGHRLDVLVTVAATTSLETNLILEVDGGKQDIHFTNSTKANAIGDVVAYEAYIRFTKS